MLQLCGADNVSGQRKFKSYTITPVLADPYRSPAAGRVTRTVFIALPVLWVIIVGLVLRLVNQCESEIRMAVVA